MKTGNDLVAEQVRYSTCFCYLPNCANQRNFAALQRIAVLLPDSSIGRIDSFLSLFTGLAFSDIHGLGKEHIVEDSNGVRWIRKGRQKTKIMCNIPLMEVPLKILEKYSTNEYCRKHGVLFPVLCNQKMNAYLKELADICGIKKTLTTHVARHTFATFALANGVSIESVAKMLGHTNVQMTRHYARVLDRTVIREMSQIKMDFHFSM